MIRVPSSIRSSAWLCCGAVALLLLVASGCWRSPPRPAAIKDQEKKAERGFEDIRVFTEPNERSSYDPQSDEDQRITLLGKPGHWAGLLVQTQANLFDFDGRLVTVPQDSQQRPVDLEVNPFWAATVRGASLPKAQRKTLETLFFPPRPHPNAPVQGSTFIATRLEGRGGSVQLQHVPELMQHLPSFQYFMLVLSPQAVRYRWLGDLPTVRPPTTHAPANVLDTFNYRVLFPPLDRALALPSQFVGWTSTAYVLWDGALPTLFSPDQQQALLDWLHWGGGLVISGPDSLDALKGSFLEPYLPATSGVAGPLARSRLAEFYTAWTVDGDQSSLPASGSEPHWSGIELVKHSSAEFLPNTAGLVVERRVGRGRIVATAFRLSELELVNWPSFDSFFNACLLGRPARRYESGRPEVHFVDLGKRDRGDLDPFDSELSTGVRILTRDERDPDVERFQPLPAEPGRESWTPYAGIDPIERLKAEPGTAGWNDFSWLSTAARESLQHAAGISVPGRGFVLKMIGLYLAVVVVLNWLVFRLISRLEWAWFAVPIVAIVWGVLVIWLAQLDIGFARAQTEIDVLEIQPGYERGHLTRYTALYTSLTSNYDLELDDSTAVALPFSAARQRLTGQSSSEVRLSTVGNRELRGFAVASNSTGMIHGEQMYSLGKPILCDLSDDGLITIQNATNIKLSGAAVIRRRTDATGREVSETAWLGTIDAGAVAKAKFAVHESHTHARHRDQELMTQPVENARGQLNLRALVDRVENHRVLAPGEVRLIAWHDDRLAKLEVSPAAAQRRAATLIVAHLAFERASSPARDLNLRPINRPPFELPPSSAP